MFKILFNSKSLNNQKGMTLLEIIIVITILASLLAVLGNQVMTSAKKAKVKEAKIQIGELAKALDSYYTDCSKYPTTEEAFSALMAGGESSCSNWGPEAYLKKEPKDPWNNPFIYTFDGTNYEIISLGEGGKEGGTGYSKDISSND
jgi:general secretion pathway protein G